MKNALCVCQKRFSWFYNNRKLQELGKVIDPEHSKYASLKGWVVHPKIKIVFIKLFQTYI